MGELGENIRLQAAREHVREVTQQSGSSFYWAMRRMHKHRREAMYAIYAFCRSVDDIADGSLSVAEKRAALEQWRAEIHRVFDNEADTKTGFALQPVVKAFSLNSDDFFAVIDGMITDAQSAVYLNDENALDTYIDRVACAVGRLSCSVFGIPLDQGQSLANSLGRALQLTNILRDLDEDAARNRLYLPASLLEKHGIPMSDPATVMVDQRVADLCCLLAETAESEFRAALKQIEGIDAKAARPARMMLEAYRRLLHRLEDRGWAAPRISLSIPLTERLWVLVRFGFF